MCALISPYQSLGQMKMIAGRRPTRREHDKQFIFNPPSRNLDSQFDSARKFFTSVKSGKRTRRRIGTRVRFPPCKACNEGILGTYRRVPTHFLFIGRLPGIVRTLHFWADAQIVRSIVDNYVSGAHRDNGHNAQNLIPWAIY